ncbi:MAG: hypothetical protein Q4B67_02845 [Eubacteriales bacterium]|nr:hypothetical protein [Eubacteriales bacterium]
MVNNRAAEVLGSQAVLPTYAVGLIFTATGYILFGIFKNILKVISHRKAVMMIIGLSASVFAAGLIGLSSAPAVLTCSFGYLLAFGYIGGFVHYSLAYSWQGSRHLGKVIGIAAGIAVFAQYAIQNLAGEAIVFLIAIFISSIAIILIAVFPKYDWILEDPLPYSREDTTDVRKALVLIVATVIMTAILSFNDSLMVLKDAENEVSLFAGTRLFYCLGLIIAGFVADIAERKYLPLVTILAMFLSIVAAAFLSDPSYFNLNMSLMYFYSGFYVMYFTVSSVAFAPLTHTPGLWSGIGRITRSLTAALFVVVTLWIPESMSSLSITIISCILSMLLLMVFFADSEAKRREEQKKAEDNIDSEINEPVEEITSEKEVTADTMTEEEPEERRIMLFASEYGLTPRETDVLKLLIMTEDGTQEIVDTLIISRRVLQRYITAIYEKTGTKTRVGLIRMVLLGTRRE